MILREMRELFTYHSKFSKRFAEHDCHNVFEKAVRDLKSVGFGEIEGKKVLDLGCGQRYPFALQCAACGATVIALDIDYIKPDFLPLAFYRMLRHNGFKRAVKSALRRLVFDEGYYNTLEAAAGKRLHSFRSGITFVVTDPESTNYPLPSDSFDLIASNAVVEHVADVPRFAEEIRRLLARGGGGGGTSTPLFTTSTRSPVGTIWNGHTRTSNRPAGCRPGITFGRIASPVGLTSIA